MKKIDIAGLKVNPITKAEFLNLGLNRIKTGQKTFAITPYSEFLYQVFQNPNDLEIFNAADFSLADGIGIFWAKKYLDLPLTIKNFWGRIIQAFWQIYYSLAAIIFYPSWIKSVLPEKIVGADLIWDLAKMAADNNLTVYLLGGFGNTPKQAGDILKSKFPNIKICGTSSKDPNDQSVMDDINKATPNILLVAYGPVKQERWIYKNLPQLHCNLAIGLGGTFDYLVGKKTAPPKFIRYSGLEWLWRLITQPQRFKRIWQATIGLISGLWHYKVFQSYPLRANVAIVILNKENRVLACQRNPLDSNIDLITNRETLSSKDYWQFPQGGIDSGEDVQTAALREAKEETGLINLELVKISDKYHIYFWNNALRRFFTNKVHRNSGQKQSIVFFKNLGTDSDVKIDNHEFINYKWIEADQIKNIIHPERVNLTNLIVADLKNITQPAKL